MKRNHGLVASRFYPLAECIGEQIGDLAAAGGVGHDDQLVRQFSHNEIVDDAASVVREDAVAGASDRHAQDIHGRQRLEDHRCLIRIPGIAREDEPAHVADIEQAGRGPGLPVLRDDAARELKRKLKPGEFGQLPAEPDMQIVERRPPRRHVAAVRLPCHRACNPMGTEGAAKCSGMPSATAFALVMGSRPCIRNQYGRQLKPARTVGVRNNRTSRRK